MATHDRASDTIADNAGVVQRQNTSFPSSERGFDSRRPLSGEVLVTVLSEWCRLPYPALAEDGGRWERSSWLC